MRHSRVCALVAVLALNASIAAPLLLSRLSQPFWWPILATIPVWAILLVRNGRAGFLVNVRAKVWLCFSAVLLLPAVILWSPWLAMINFWLLAATASRCLRNQGGRSAFAISHCSLLLLAGLPTRFARPAWDELTRDMGHYVLLENLRAGKLAWLDGAVLCSNAGRLAPDVVCNSPFAWGGLLALAWLLLLLRRASFLQSILVLSISGVLGLLVSAAVIWFSFSHATSEVTASISPDAVTWCVAALAGVILVVSLDIFVSALAAPIPASADNRHDAGTRCLMIWNRWVSGVPVIHGNLSTDNSQTVTSFSDWFRWPEWSELWDSLWAWWYSRSVFRLAIGLPVLVMVATVLSFRSGNVDREAEAVTRVEALRERARDDGDSQLEENALRALISLQPQFGALQLRLVEFFWAAGRREDCLRQLQPLIADGDLSWPAARLWLVRNSLQSNPLQSLTPEERVEHLRNVVEAEPTNSEALILLAQEYLRLGEMALAERAFVKAADADSKLNRQLLNFYQASGRPNMERRRFELHLEHLLQKFRVSPESPDALTELAQFQVLMGLHDQALAAISQLRGTQDSEPLQRLEAEVRTARVRLTSQSAFLRMQSMIDDVEVAMSLAPDSMESLSLSVVMKLADGAEFDRQVVQQVLDHWLAKKSGDDEVACGQGMALVLAEQYDRAVESLRNVGSLTAPMQLALIYAWRRSGNTEQAEQAAQSAVAALDSLVNTQLRRQAAQFWAAAGVPERALSLSSAEATTDPELAAFVALNQFDQATNYPGDLSDFSRVWQLPATIDAKKVLSSLKTALRQPVTQSGAARRLYRLRKSAVELRRKIENWLLELRAEQGDSEQVLLILGTMGLNEEDWDDALYWLDATVRTARTASTAALNNLAIAIVRSNTRARYPEAMTLVNAALRQSPDNPDLLASRGEVAMALEQWDAAREDLERVLNLQPEHPDALRLLPIVYVALGDEAAATALRRRRIEGGSRQ